MAAGITQQHSAKITRKLQTKRFSPALISHTDERRRYHRRQDLSQTGKRGRAPAWRKAGIIGMIHTAIITARV